MDSSVNLTHELMLRLADALKVGDMVNIIRCIEAGADINGRLPSGFPVMRYGSNETAIRLIAEYGGDLNVVHDGLAWIHLAAMQDVRIVSSLLKHGANPNIVDAEGRSALFCAEAFKEVETVGVLLKAGADPNIHRRGGFTVLHEAVASGDLQIASLLIGAGSEIDAVDDDDQTPTLVATYMDGVAQLQMLRLLISAGANVNMHRRSDGFAPIHFAAARGVEVVQAIVNAGADILVKTQCGLSPIDIARSQNNEAVYRFLRRIWAGLNHE